MTIDPKKIMLDQAILFLWPTVAQHREHWKCSSSYTEYMQVRFPAVHGVRYQVDATYERPLGEHIWRLNRKETQRMRKISKARLDATPQRASICGTDHVPVRTAKTHATLRE